MNTVTKDASFEDAFAEFAGGAPAPDTDGTPEPQAAALDAEPLAEGGEPAPAPPPAPAPAPAPAEAAAPAPAPAVAPPEPTLDDVLALLPEDKREAYRAVIDKTKADLHRLHSDDGRVAAMQRLYGENKARAEKAEQALKDAQAKVDAALTPKETAAAAAELAEAEAALEEFPAIKKGVNLLIEQRLKGMKAPEQPAPEVQQEKPKEQPADDAAVTALADQFAALTAAHPGWQEAVRSPQFSAWFEAQAKPIKKLISSNDAEDAIYLLNGFKSAVAAARQRQAEAEAKAQRERLEQHVEVKGAPARISAPPDNFEAAFNFFTQQKPARAGA